MKQDQKKVENQNELKALLVLLLAEGRKSIEETIEKYQARFYELGIDAGVDLGGADQTLTFATSMTEMSRLIDEQQEAVDGWMNTVEERVIVVLTAVGFSAESVRAAVKTQRYRATSFSMSGHRITYKGFKSEMIGQSDLIKQAGLFRIEAIFTAFPEADIIETSCDGCMGAVAGNPYLPETVPGPGDFECMFNCRHEIWYRKVLIKES